MKIEKKKAQLPRVLMSAILKVVKPLTNASICSPILEVPFVILTVPCQKVVVPQIEKLLSCERAMGGPKIQARVPNRRGAVPKMFVV